MNEHPILVQKKYARVVALFARENDLSLERALDIFYRSERYDLMGEGVSDMHGMSDAYLALDWKEGKQPSDSFAFRMISARSSKH